MCGRYKQNSDLARLREDYGLQATGDIDVQGVMTPGMQAPVIHADAGGQPVLSLMTWGFVPHWTRENTGARLINARAETAAEKPTFRDAFRQRRCLVPANGFYEWDIQSKPKRAYHFMLPQEQNFCFAGLWDRWQQPDGTQLHSFAILTLPAAAPIDRIHDRMPLVLADDGARRAWLQGKEAAIPAFDAAQLEMAPFDFPAKARAVDSRQASLF